MESILPSNTPLKFTEYSTIPTPANNNVGPDPIQLRISPRRTLAVRTAIIAGVITAFCAVMIGRESTKWTLPRSAAYMSPASFPVTQVAPPMPVPGPMMRKGAVISKTVDSHSRTHPRFVILENPEIHISVDENGNMVNKFTYLAPNPPHAAGLARCQSGSLKDCQCGVQFPSCAAASGFVKGDVCICIFVPVRGPCPWVARQVVTVSAICSK